MVSRIVLAREALDRSFSWSNLSIFGNSYLAKLVALAPIVAVYVKLQEKYLLATVGFSQAKWLYWSLIAIAVGQFLYFLFAGRTIKKYGQDRQKYIMEADATWTTKEFEEAECKILLWYVGTKDSLFSLHPDIVGLENKEAFLKVLRDNHWNASFGSGNVAADVYNGVVQLRNLLDPKTRSSVGEPGQLAKAVYWVINFEPTLLQIGSKYTKDAATHKSDLTRLVRAFASSAEKVDVKRLALSWHFNQADFQHTPIRILVAFLYVGGTTYFVWRTIFALLFMVGVPGFEFDFD